MAEFNVYFSKPQKGESTKMTRAIQAKRAKFAKELAKKKERELISEDELFRILRKRIVPYSYESIEPGVSGSKRVLTMKEKEREAKKEEEKRYKDMKKRAMERLLDLETKAEKDIYRGEKEARKLEREAREMRERMEFMEPRGVAQAEEEEDDENEEPPEYEAGVEEANNLFERLKDVDEKYKVTQRDIVSYDEEVLKDLNFKAKELKKIAKLYGVKNDLTNPNISKNVIIGYITKKVEKDKSKLVAGEPIKGKGLFSKKSKSTKSTKSKHPEEGSPFKHLFDLHLPKTTSKSTKAKKQDIKLLKAIKKTM
jgi:hypothetical protein